MSAISERITGVYSSKSGMKELPVYDYEQEFKEFKNLLYEKSKLENEYQDKLKNKRLDILKAEIEAQRARNDALYKSQIDREINLYKTKQILEERFKKLEEKSFRSENKALSKSDSKKLKALKDYQKTLRKYDEETAARREKEEALEQSRKIANLTKLEREQLGISKAEQKAAKTVTKELEKELGDSSSRKNSVLGKALNSLVSNLFNSFTTEIDSIISSVSSYQGRWNTRLYGTGLRYEDSLGGLGKFYSGGQGLATKVTNALGISPYIQTSKVLEKMDEMIDVGIAYNIDQRAFLDVMSDKIATTFDATNETLLQLVRIQKADTTAARLGMEASITTFLNNMYQNTEYLSSLYDSVTANLYEAVSQFDVSSGLGIDLEYTVQKWLGALYSSGMSASTIQSISSALGMLGSGNIAGLSGNQQMQNLIVRAASNAGISYADLLNQGLSASKVDLLMSSMIKMLSDVYSSNSNVVRSQYGNIYGLSLSDIKAISNIQPDLGNISGSVMDYSSTINYLYDMADMIGSRTSMGEGFTNTWANLKYNIGSNIATSPAMYALWEVTGALKDAVGGISIPTISVFGNMVDLETNVADMIKVGMIGTSLLGSIGSMLTTSGTSGFNIGKILNTLGVANKATAMQISRGAYGLGTRMFEQGEQTSSSSFVGNTAGSDIYEQSMASANDQKTEAMADVKDEDTVDLETINNSITMIYDLFNDVVNGSKSLSVAFDSYQFASFDTSISTGGQV